MSDILMERPLSPIPDRETIAKQVSDLKLDTAEHHHQVFDEAWDQLSWEDRHTAAFSLSRLDQGLPVSEAELCLVMFMREKNALADRAKKRELEARAAEVVAVSPGWFMEAEQVAHHAGRVAIFA